jgi:uncharacterized membrane protein YgdD (TMEM256/DUF423 family)
MESLTQEDVKSQRFGLYCLRTGVVLAGLSVALGAFGAHALPQDLEPRMREIWSLAVQYQFYHALGLCLLSLGGARWRWGYFRIAAWAFGLGILCFSGSLYLLVLSGQKWLGAVTPLGGVAFMLGWIGLLFATFNHVKRVD